MAGSVDMNGGRPFSTWVNFIEWVSTHHRRSQASDLTVLDFGGGVAWSSSVNVLEKVPEEEQSGCQITSPASGLVNFLIFVFKTF